jgi:arylsulfatase A-like enzyme
MSPKKYSRRNFMKTTGFGLAAASLAAPAMAQGGKRPNIVFIMTDDHASHALSCYGSKINKTPNLDRIAAQGMRFNNCFCTNSICGPSRASILSGKYSHMNGFYTNGRPPFDGTQTTFPKLLQQAGYQTAMIGKWHLGSDPTGFDYWKILPGQGLYHNPVFIEMGTRITHQGYVTDIITDDCLRWLSNRDKEKPFCLMYHHKAPHRAWDPDEKHADLYEDQEIPYPDTFNDTWETRSDAARDQTMTIENHLTPRDLKVDPPAGLEGEALKKWKYQRYIKDYLRCVASVDDNVGRFLDYLDDEGLTENTVVVYTSDQGFYLGDHGWFDKRFMYEESLRMPLLVRYPNHIQAGSVNNDIVLNIDFASTFLDLAGVKAPEEFQGESLKEILQGNTPKDWRKSMYYHYYEYPGAHMVKRHFGVRNERYKLIRFYYDIDAWEFYDLQEDPRELRNVYGDPRYAAIIKDMKQELERLREKYGDSDEKARDVLKKDIKDPNFDPDHYLK